MEPRRLGLETPRQIFASIRHPLQYSSTDRRRLPARRPALSEPVYCRKVEFLDEVDVHLRDGGGHLFRQEISP